MVTMTIPHKTMIKGMKTLGRRRLRRTLVSGSKREYETKKMDKVALY